MVNAVDAEKIMKEYSGKIIKSLNYEKTIDASLEIISNAICVMAMNGAPFVCIDIVKHLQLDDFMTKDNVHFYIMHKLSDFGYLVNYDTNTGIMTIFWSSANIWVDFNFRKNY